MKHSPRILNKIGKRHWKKYLPCLKNPDPIQLSTLEDLCYWEQMKEEAQRDIENPKKGYTQETPKGYVQSSPYFNNFKTAQEKINTLKNQLFGEDKKAKAEEKPKSRGRKKEDFTIRKII